MKIKRAEKCKPEVKSFYNKTKVGVHKLGEIAFVLTRLK